MHPALGSVRVPRECSLFHRWCEKHGGLANVRDDAPFLCYISNMVDKELQAIVDRIQTWPAEKQRLAHDLLIWLEAKDEDDASDLTAEDWADLEEGLAEADRGEFVSEEEMRTFFDKYR
jgi:hypothetical protein